MSALDAGQALPRQRMEILPALTPLVVALAAAPLIGSFSTFVTLTAAGLAMGMMIFTMASGLTLVFGMMDVLNFGHGAFIALGAYAATLVLLPLASWSNADSVSLNLAVFILAMLAAALVCGAFGWVFERLIVKPVYGQHLKLILATIGGAIIAEQLLYAVFGPAQIPLNVPKTFEGSFIFGEAAIEKYRVLATLVGLLVFGGEMLVLNRTKIGLLVRAGVENREMVEALGYRVDRLFVAVFMAGSALAGLGGAMMALYRGQVHATIGGEFLVLCFIVIIIGGLGSVGGSFVASILVALIANYAGFLAPKVALVSNILAMVVVLLWRPRGLYPVSGRALQILLVVIILALALAPFLFPGAKALNVAAKTCVMILLAASYDLLLGYAGIVSFAHVMFFGVGAYGVGLMLYTLGGSWGALVAGLIAAAALSLALALAIGLFSLRVQSIFFAMVTLAVAYAFNVLASQLSGLTGGEDGRSFKAPEALQPGFRLTQDKLFGVALTGKILTYYLVFAVVAVAFLVLLRAANSPFGRVLQAIRENPFRAEALGYRTVFHRTLATCISALGATLAGALFALWLRYVGPDTALSFSIQVDVLVMVVVGGMGSLYGAIIGAALFVFAESYLQDVMAALSQAAANASVPLLPALFHPDRWLLWLGLAFVLAVYFAPSGIVGALKGDEPKAN
jgi:ABC-type branched-subunit amino acid transport system permease subunit